MSDNLRNFFERLNPFAERERRITVYPTYAYRSAEGAWNIPLRVWVRKPRRIALDDQLLGYIVNLLLDDDDERDEAPQRRDDLTGAELARLRHCLTDFIADDDSNEVVAIKFDNDPDDETYPLARRTDLNGLVIQDFQLSDGRMEQLLAAQDVADHWLRVRAVCEGFEGAGRVRVMNETPALSVVSDIDDTIKVTEVPAGKRIVARNTFTRDYEYVPEMLKMYQKINERYAGFDGVAFHYVSGSPWQMHGLLQEFLIEQSGFPPGTFHMKELRKNPLVPESWRSIKNYIAGRETTMTQKIEQIRTLMRTLPQRQFVLIGDSGERDPEVFRAIKSDREFIGRVKEIIIRDVLEERFDGMNVIEVPPADRVRPGVSRYDRAG